MFASGDIRLYCNITISMEKKSENNYLLFVWGHEKKKKLAYFFLWVNGENSYFLFIVSVNWFLHPFLEWWWFSIRICHWLKPSSSDGRSLKIWRSFFEGRGSSHIHSRRSYGVLSTCTCTFVLIISQVEKIRKYGLHFWREGEHISSKKKRMFFFILSTSSETVEARTLKKMLLVISIGGYYMTMMI